MPRFLTLRVHLRPGRMFRESKIFASDVTVWGKGSLFFHVTVSPALTFKTVGENCIPSIAMVCIVTRGAAKDGMPGPISAAHINRALHRFCTVALRWDNGNFIVCYFIAVWMPLAWSRWATNKGRTLTKVSLSSAFFALGTSVLSSVSITAS